MSETKLDIGCGNKKRQGFIGLDTRPTLQTDYVCSLQEAHNIFPYGTVDEIYSRRVFQHIPDDVAAFKEVSKLLKVGGRATIIVSGYRPWLYYQLWWKHTRDYQNIYPCFHLYTKGRLERKFEKAGWSLFHKDISFKYAIHRTSEGCRHHSFDLAVELVKLPALDELEDREFRQWGYMGTEMAHEHCRDCWTCVGEDECGKGEV